MLGLMASSAPFLFYGCGGETEPTEPPIENYCGWLADPDNCYRQFARDTSVNGFFECARLGDQTADDALGYFLDREGLNICVLQEGGVLQIEGLADLINPPPPDPSGGAAVPVQVAFDMVKQNNDQCGRVEWFADNDFTLIVEPSDTVKGGTFVFESGTFGSDSEPRETALSTCPDIVPEGGGDPVPEQHYFDTLLTLKCPQYADLVPRLELEVVKGGLDIEGKPSDTEKYGAFKARVVFPPKEGALENAKAEKISLFTCVIPPPPEPCFDEMRNGLETGTDCGGPICERRCGADETCATEADCVAGFVCDYVVGIKVCQDPNAPQ